MNLPEYLPAESKSTGMEIEFTPQGRANTGWKRRDLAATPFGLKCF